MRSVFIGAPFARFDLGRHALNQPKSRASMGQMTDPYLTQAERDQILAGINAAIAKVKPIDDLMVWGGENDPGLKKFLGLDSTRFSALTNSIAGLYPTVTELRDRLAETDAEYWYRPSAEESAAVKQWTTGISEMYKLIEKAKGGDIQLRLPYGKPLPVSIQQPLSTGSVTGGLKTNDLLIGGAVAVGLGVLIYALAG